MRISRYRQWIIIGIVVVVLYPLLFSHLVRGIRENRNTLERKKKEMLLYSSSEALNNYYLSLKNYQEKRIKEYKEFKTVPEGITRLLGIVDSSNLKTKSIHHSVIRDAGNIPYITVETEITGKYSNFCSFLHLLTSHPLKIEKIRMKYSSSGIFAYLRIRLFLSEDVKK